MHDFVFHNPTKILFGRGTTQAVGPETALLGRRALLVYGQGSIRENGLYDRVAASLGQAGIDWLDHPGARPNPVLAHVREGIGQARRHRAEVIVAVGGGSVIDTAKAIAAGVPVEHDVWKFFTGKRGIKAPLPILTVPTLAASGSEMNNGMVLTNEATREKLGIGHRLLHPRTSILDPETTFTVPPDHTAYGAIDAVSHALEFYLSTTDPDTPVQDRLMEGLIETCMAASARCLADPCDYHGRASLMWSAALALSGLTAAGLGRVALPMHLIEHSLSALYDVPHGAGLAVVMLGWLRAHAEQAAGRIGGLGQRLFPHPNPGTAQEEAHRTIHRLQAWLAALRAPLCLADLSIPAGDIPIIADNTRSQARLWRLREYSPERVAAILHFCL